MKLTFPPQNPVPGDAIALRQISQATRQALLGGGTFQNSIAITPKTVTHDDTPYTLSNLGFILLDTSGGNIAVNLPPASAFPNTLRYFKKSTGDSGVVQLNADGSDTIDGASTYMFSGAYEAYVLYCDGVQWLSI